MHDGDAFLLVCRQQRLEVVELSQLIDELVGYPAELDLATLELLQSLGSVTSRLDKLFAQYFLLLVDVAAVTDGLQQAQRHEHALQLLLLINTLVNLLLELGQSLELDALMAKLLEAF